MTGRTAVVLALLLLAAGCQSVTQQRTTPQSFPTPDEPHSCEKLSPKTLEPGVTDGIPPVSWRLSLWIENFSSSKPYQISTTVAAGGNKLPGKFVGVKVFFLNANKSIMNSVVVGNITDETKPRWANATLSQKPRYIVPKIDWFKVSNNRSGEIIGAEWTSDNRFISYRVGECSNYTY